MENEHVCPKCGAHLRTERNYPSFSYICDNCGWEAVTTIWDPIDLDDTIFTVSLLPGDPVTKETLSLVSKLTGKNFIESKKLIESNGVIFSGKAREIQSLLKNLDDGPINVRVSPNFPY